MNRTHIQKSDTTQLGLLHTEHQTYDERERAFQAKHGCDVWASGRTLMSCPLLEDGTPEMEGGEPHWHEVTSADQTFLDDVNNLLGTHFKMSQFNRR